MARALAERHRIRHPLHRSGGLLPRRSLFADSVRFRVGVGAIVALHLIFVIAPPLLSSDIFNYVGYARLEVVHHLNAYVKPLAAAPTDPSYIYVALAPPHDRLRPAVHAGQPAARLDQLPGGDLALKVFTGIASLVCVWLVWLCATRLGRPAMPGCALLRPQPDPAGLCRRWRPQRPADARRRARRDLPDAGRAGVGDGGDGGVGGGEEARPWYSCRSHCWARAGR